MDVRFHASEDGLVAFSTGMQGAGLPNVARMLPAGAPLDDVVEAMTALVRKIVAERWHPNNTEQFLFDPIFALRRVQDAVWMHPVDQANDAGRDRVARYRFGLERCLSRMLKREVFTVDVPEPGYRIDHYEGFSTTNGLGFEHRFEVGCFTSRVGPRVTQLLSIIAELASAREMRAFDRIAHPQPLYGLAGHVLWPCGHARAMDELVDIQLFDALPIYEHELQAFRNDGAAQQAWIDNRNERRDVHEIQARWHGVFDG